LIQSKMKQLLFIITPIVLLLAGCNQSIKKHSGKIKVDLYIYNDPTGDIYDSFYIPVSTLYFIGDEFLEELPVYEDTAVNTFPYVYIKGDSYAFLSSLSEKNRPDL